MAGFSGWVVEDGVSFDKSFVNAKLSDWLRGGGDPVSELSGSRWHIVAGKTSGIAQSGAWSVVVHGAGKVRGGAPKSGNGFATAILAIFEENDVEALQYVDGQYCVALISSDARRIIIATDKLGLQPVHFSRSPSGVLFSTSIQSFFDCPLVQLNARLQSIYDYLYFHVIPSPATIFEEVSVLPPAHYAEILADTLTTRRYWELAYNNESGRSDISSLRVDLKRILRNSVVEAIEGADSVGCFLSGGVDSTTISGVLKEVSDLPLKTYSIGFDVAGFDEMEYARIASRHFGADHHEYYVKPGDVAELLPKIPEVYGTPFGNSSVVPTYFCARMAEQDGTKMLLAGDGGDELFGGNERYATQRLFGVYDKLPSWARHRVLEPLASNLPMSDRVLLLRKLKRYVEQARIPLPDRLDTYSHLNVFGPLEIFDRDFLDCVDPDFPIRSRRSWYEDVRATNSLNKMLALDLKYTLADNDIPKVSRMCELAGVDVSYPLLNHSLLEFAAQLPARDKVRGVKLRYFFKTALDDFLPPEVLTKSKHGFGLPIGDWFVSDERLGSMAGDLLSDLKKRRLLKSSFLEDLHMRWLPEHPKYYGNFVWVLAVLELWLKRHGGSVVGL